MKRKTKTVEEVVCWVNSWGDLDTYDDKSLVWREGYRQAMSDTLPRVDALAPDWLDAWQKWARV